MSGFPENPTLEMHDDPNGFIHNFVRIKVRRILPINNESEYLKGLHWGLVV